MVDWLIVLTRMNSREGAVSGGGDGERKEKKCLGGTAFWGRLSSNSASVQFRADLRGTDISFGRSSRCDAPLPVFMWISGVHFIVHYVVPGAAGTKKRAKDDDECEDADFDEDDDDDDDDDDEEDPYVEIEDKSRFGTWLNGVLIGQNKKMRAQDGDKITLRAPSRHAESLNHAGKVESFSLTLRLLNKADLNKQLRFLISDTHPINKKYVVLNTIGEFVNTFFLSRAFFFTMVTVLCVCVCC